jgi:exodeoxyribonuclease VII large subunit
VAALVSRLQSGMGRQFAERHARLQRAAQGLTHLDPDAVLQRGYALALDASGVPVTDAARLRVGDRLLLRLARGEVDTRVERVAAPDASSAE